MEKVQDTPVSYIEFDLGHKKVKARAWKGKDRKNFKIALKTAKDIDKAIIESLVTNCLENKDELLTNEELKYLFIELRKVSISDNFDFEYKCTSCDKLNKVNIKLEDINKLTFKPFNIVNGIEFGPIVNASFYKKNKDDDDEIKEISFYTKSINGDISKSFKEIVEYYEEMDVNEFDKIYYEFKHMLCKVDNIKELTCECGASKKFEFDEIPGFFPESWNS